MVSRSTAVPLTRLEQVDLVLAERAAERVARAGGTPLSPVEAATAGTRHRHACIAGLLGVRGLEVTPDEVEAVLLDRPGRLRPTHQEHRLVVGFDAVLAAVERRAAAGRPLDGWFLVECFRRVTERIARFRNNTLRRDDPWDGLPMLRYPDPALLRDELDRFHAPESYGDDPARFAALHPARRAFRVFWRFARLAPFPDFNLPLAWVAMNALLRAAGYPPLVPREGDRAAVHSLVQGVCPVRFRVFEDRLLEQVTGDR